ncbi:MAG: hypothetical protein KC643_15765 [Nitrospira sp.]|nr:hypothetical protein [Nitrospira sp.]
MYNVIMNKLNPAKRAQIIAALVEGNSINATVRMAGAASHAEREAPKFPQRLSRE